MLTNEVLILAWVMMGLLGAATFTCRYFERKQEKREAEKQFPKYRYFRPQPRRAQNPEPIP